MPLLVRVPVAVALVAWGGLTNRKWTVPLGAAVAMPVLWISALSVLAALPALDRPELQPKGMPAPARPAHEPAEAALTPTRP